MPCLKATRKRLAARACDSCKVRKIRCTEAAPCVACKRSGIECTFKTAQAQRGPRGLRPVTIQRIQGHAESTFCSRKENPPLAKQSDQLRLLAGLIDTYASRLFPVWPILDATKLKQELKAKPSHTGTWHLANAVALATAAQLKLDTAWHTDPEQIKRGRSSALGSADPLDDLRVSFFLHVHHENSAPGGKESLLYLREAITLAQMLRLEHEATYILLPNTERHVYRRVLWLLFVTERGVALLHKLPPILKPNILFPWHSTPDDTYHVLPAFLKLLQLFWIVDQSGIIEMLENAEHDASTDPYPVPLAGACLELLQPKLQQSVTEDDWGPGTDEQRADVFLTRQWMRAILWRAALRFEISGAAAGPVDPVDIAREFLSLAGKVPAAALEAHGATLEFKTFEVATAVVDAIVGNYCLGLPTDHVAATLVSLRNMLSSFRGGNKNLLPRLEGKMQSIFGLGAAARPLGGNDEQHGTVAGSNEKEDWNAEGSPLQSEELLTTLSVGVSAQDGGQFIWTSSNLAGLLDYPSQLTEICREPSAVGTIEELFTPNSWELDA